MIWLLIESQYGTLLGANHCTRNVCTTSSNKLKNDFRLRILYLGFSAVLAILLILETNCVLAKGLFADQL